MLGLPNMLLNCKELILLLLLKLSLCLGVWLKFKICGWFCCWPDAWLLLFCKLCPLVILFMLFGALLELLFVWFTCWLLLLKPWFNWLFWFWYELLFNWKVLTFWTYWLIIDDLFISNKPWYWYSTELLRVLYCSLVVKNIDFCKGRYLYL